MIRFLLFMAIVIPPCSSLIAMEEGVVSNLEMQVDQLARSRAASLSPENSDLEGRLDELLSIFDDVTKIEDEQYLKMVMDVLVKSRGEETFKQVSPYLSNKLRNSYKSIRELTQLRKRSSLKKLMRTLITESIEEAFTRQQSRYDDLDRISADNIKRYRYGVVVSLVGGVTACLTTFFATYFAH